MASFVCSACGTGNLRIVLFIELPPSGDDDEITLQIIQCTACGFQGMAIYRESRHGAMDSESWSHTGYELLPPDLERLRSAILSCTAPDDSRCECEAHKSVAGIDWTVPARAFSVRRQFNMDLA